MLARDGFNGKATEFAGHEEEYRMAHFFDTNHLHNRSAPAPPVLGQMARMQRVLKLLDA